MIGTTRRINPDTNMIEYSKMPTNVAADGSTKESLIYCIDPVREAGKLVFQQERWFQRLLHNETAYQLQRRLQFLGLNAMVLPVRVLAGAPAQGAA